MKINRDNIAVSIEFDSRSKSNGDFNYMDYYPTGASYHNFSASERYFRWKEK